MRIDGRVGDPLGRCSCKIVLVARRCFGLAVGLLIVTCEGCLNRFAKLTAPIGPVSDRPSVTDWREAMTGRMGIIALIR